MVSTVIKIGEQLVREGIIDHMQLQKAMEEHRKSGELLGRVLVDMGMVKEDLLRDYLKKQMRSRDSRRMGEALVQDGFITQDQLASALEMSQRTGKKIGSVLVKKGFINENQLMEMLSAKLNVSFVDLDNCDIPLSVRAILPEELCHQYKVIPLGKEGNKVKLAMIDPADLKAIDILRFKMGADVETVMVSERALSDAMDRIYKRGELLSRSSKDTLVRTLERMLDAQKSVVEQQERIMQQQRIVMGSLQELLQYFRHSQG